MHAYSLGLVSASSIFKLTAAYKADPFPQKVNLGVGAYRDDNNKPWVLPVVRKATHILINDLGRDHEYLPITGLPEYTSAAGKLIFGLQSAALKEGRVTSVQTISGTGANHLGALFLSRFYQWNGPPTIYLSNPTWANHHAIFKNVGIEPKDHPYFEAKTVGLDFVGFTDTVKAAPARSIFLLHACAHNPTGVDPTMEQWAELANLFLEKGHYAFFDCAYQGFASGDLEQDIKAVRHFEERGVPMLVCQSFAKNAGLYSERIGALHVVGGAKDEATRVKSQLSVLQRSEISNPPGFGARLIGLILNDPVLFDEWKVDIKVMAHRIIDMRYQLHAKLTNELKTPGNWDHIIKQIGMFSFTGLNPTQVKAVVEKAHIYMTGNGRISMAGLNSGNIAYVAESIDKAMAPSNTGKDKAPVEEEEDILQAVVLADSFNSRFGPLTMDLPRCLLPVCNTTLLDWTFEALSSAGVQQIFVFCCSHVKLIREAINESRWAQPGSGLKITPIFSREARSVGDALREIDAKQIITQDFVLATGDIVSNIRIDEVVKEHKERRKRSKDPIMTMVVREVGPRDRPRPGGDATVVVMDAESSECVHYEYVPHGKSDFELPAEVITAHRDLDVRIDLLDCGIDICTPDVPALFSENFDYQELRKDFVRGVLTSDLLTKTIFCHVAKKGYASRVRNTRTYGSISKDIIARRTFPLVPDDNHLGGESYELRRGYVYVAKTGVSLSRTCTIGTHTIIGPHSTVQNDAYIVSSVIGQGCEIGEGSVIKDSYIWAGASIGPNCSIEESIVGNDVKIQAGSVIRRGCLIGKDTVLGPSANLSEFQQVSRAAPRDDDDDWTDNGSVADGTETTETSDASDVPVESDMVPILGSKPKAYLWPVKEDGEEEDEEDVETSQALRLGRLGDTGSDIEVLESDLSEIGSGDSSPMGSPFSMASASSAALGGPIPDLDLESASDFASECRQSLERAYEEGHTIDNAGIELKTLRMATNVPLVRVADCVVSFLVGKIALADAPAAQKANVKTVLERWGPLLTSIGWTDAVETVLMLQKACAQSPPHQKVFASVLASLYNEDIVEYEDLKRWYTKVLEMKKQGLEPHDILATNLENCMQQALPLMQQIHAAEAEDDDTEEDDDDESEGDEKKVPVATVKTQAGGAKGKPATESDDDEEEQGEGTEEEESD
ncbi:Aspartate aminotransferase, cytoplasmic [Tulasnella sp. 332]|nr:Aspartate aminotransferase, cytoplasmic [Tulasnella sp. 332]